MPDVHCPQCGAALPAVAAEGLCPKCVMQLGLERRPEASGGGSDPASAATDAYHGGFVPPTPEQLAADFPQLEIVELVGRGGMGAVYKARQPSLDRLVAVKILPPESDGRSFAERFAREARALARLSHPNIVAVHDFGQTPNGLYYFVMEYVDGLNLRELIRRRSLAPHEALAIVPQVCEALQFAHDEGIVHRDIKPENILVDRRGRVKIADFGLAKLLGRQPADYTLTGHQQVMGTPHYMAPEQMERPGDVDHRADIYSLGVVFYEMLTGELPLGRFQPPSQKVAVDVRLDEIVLRALEREPQRRYQAASEIKTRVESLSDAAGTSIPTSKPSEQVAPDAIVERRMRVTVVVFLLLTSLPFWALQLAYLAGAPWYFEERLPYVLLRMLFQMLGALSALLFVYWWYVRAKDPAEPRTLEGVWKSATTPDPRARGACLPTLGFVLAASLLAALSVLVLDDRAATITMGLLLTAAPFIWMAIVAATYPRRPTAPLSGRRA